jgi:hypothetical protein
MVLQNTESHVAASDQGYVQGIIRGCRCLPYTWRHKPDACSGKGSTADEFSAVHDEWELLQDFKINDLNEDAA